MGTHWGKGGVVKSGANAVAEIDEWEFSQTVDPVIDTAMGDADETHIAGSGIKKWTGSLNCHWSDNDTNGQDTLTVGASVTLELYPDGTASGAIYWTGTASIIERGMTVKKDGETTRVSFRFMGNGALTKSAVA